MPSLVSLAIAVAAIGIALYAYAVSPEPSKLAVRPSPLLDSILKEHRAIIGEDMTAYRNHCLRVYHLAIVASQRRSPLSGEKFARRDEILQIATAFHDIGLWTDDTVAYLAPSEKRAAAWLASHDRSADIPLITALIEEHHKVTEYKGPFAPLVTDFLQADWSDVALGLAAFGNITRGDVRAMQLAFPNAGFHARLMRFGVQQLFRDPLHPLPMFKL